MSEKAEDPTKKKTATKKAFTPATKKTALKKPALKKKRTTKRRIANRVSRRSKDSEERSVGRGRPLKFRTVKELEEAIEAYFNSLYEPLRDKDGCKIFEDGKPVMTKTRVATVTALAVALDTTRDILIDYENGKHDKKAEDLSDDERAENEQIDSFSNTIKKAKQRIYADTEQALYSRNSVTGAIFSLKNNYAWHDRQEIETKDLTPPPPLSPRKAKEISNEE